MAPAPAAVRLASLDAFRGLIMLTLLAGSLFHDLRGHGFAHLLYEQNEHVAWEGCVYWDLIQPGFMFIVGAAMPLRAANRPGRSLAARFLSTFLRSVKLILVDVALDHFGQSNIQVGFIRVLQQIALAQLLAFVFVGRGLLVQALAVVVILTGYTIAWQALSPEPWIQGGDNLGKMVDRFFLNREYRGNYVGLNFVPSAATMTLGVMAGTVLTKPWTPARKAAVLAIAGNALLYLGLGMEFLGPMVKRIWTASFAVYSAGWVTAAFAGFYWFIDVKGRKREVFPLVVVGMNSIAAYVIASLFGGWFKSLSVAWLAPVEPFYGIWFGTVQRLAFVAAAWLVLYWLYRRKVFFKL